jgi:hypothetical protein
VPFSLGIECCNCSVILKSVISRARCSLTKARRLRRRQVASYTRTFIAPLSSAHTYLPQLLKHGMNAFVQSRARRLTSDRLLSQAVAMRRQTLGRAAIASGADSFASLTKSIVLPRVLCVSGLGARICFYICFIFSASFLECEDFGCRCCSRGSVPRRVRARACDRVQVCLDVAYTISICINIIGIFMIIVTRAFAELRLCGSVLERAGGCKRHCP